MKKGEVMRLSDVQMRRLADLVRVGIFTGQAWNAALHETRQCSPELAQVLELYAEKKGSMADPTVTFEMGKVAVISYRVTQFGQTGMQRLHLTADDMDAARFIFRGWA